MKALEYIASLLYHNDCIEKGHAGSTKWWCTEKKIKRKFIKRANKLVNDWYKDNIACKKKSLSNKKKFNKINKE